MERHKEKAAVQQYACAVLWNISIKDENKLAIAQTGGITTIIAAMKGHGDSGDVQKYSCGALRNLALNGKASKHV